MDNCTWGLNQRLCVACLSAGQCAERRKVAVTLNLNQAMQLLRMFGGEDAEISVKEMAGHSGPGLYAYFSEYPEEGVEKLDAERGVEVEWLKVAPASATSPSNWVPVSKNPDLDGLLWPIAVKLHAEGRVLYKADFEYYHFDNGWATDEEVVAWLPVPVPNMDRLPLSARSEGRGANG